MRARAAQAAIMRSVSGNLDALGPRYERARVALQALLWPGAQHCGGNDVRCLMTHGHNRLTVAHDGLKLAGPLKLGSTLSEDLLLEYIDGLPPQEVGWGRAASPERLRQLLPLHVLYANLMRRTRELASAGGTPLTRLMLLLLEERPVAGALPGPRIPPSARLIVLAGHDTNLSNVGSILGLDWTLPGEPDSTAPDTTLALELWRDGQGRKYIRSVVFYQTLSELRAEAMGAKADADGLPVRAYPLIFPGCRRRQCPLSAVSARIESRIDVDCGRPDPAIRMSPAGAH